MDIIDELPDDTSRFDWTGIAIQDCLRRVPLTPQLPTDAEKERRKGEEGETVVVIDSYHHSLTHPLQQLHKTLLEDNSANRELKVDQPSATQPEASEAAVVNLEQTLEPEDKQPDPKPVATKLVMTRTIQREFETIRSLPAVAISLEPLMVNLGAPKRIKATRKTVIFDLDDTLIHTVSGPLLPTSPLVKNNVIHELPYIYPKTGEKKTLSVIVRPYALELLKQAAHDFEMIVFTASDKAYADSVLNVLDPTNELIDHRLYRSSCIRVGKSFIKDLRILNRDLASVVLIENSIVAFSNQLENGIYVPLFTGNSEDKELSKLAPTLRQLVNVSDMRAAITEMYGLSQLFSDYVQ